MDFPELIKIEDVKARREDDTKKYALYKLDWSGIGRKTLINRINWWAGSGLEINKDDLDYYVDNILEKSEIEEYFFPPELQQKLDDASLIVIPEDYYNEMMDFKELAIKQWTKRRSFDTSIREGCLTVAIEAIDRFFFLLQDCFLWSDLSDKTKLDRDDPLRRTSYIKSFWLFRFWKHRTGSGLVVRRAFEKNRDSRNEYFYRLSIQDQDWVKEGLERYKELENYENIFDKNMEFQLIISDKKRTNPRFKKSGHKLSDVSSIVQAYRREERLEKLLDNE